MKYSPILGLLLSPRQTISGSTSYNLAHVQEATNTKRQFSYTHYEDFEELPFQRTAGQFGHIGLTVDNNDGFTDYDPNGEIFDKDDLQKHFDYDDVYKNAKYNNHCGDPSYPIKCSSSYGSYGLCISTEELCDGISDCLNGYDEHCESSPTLKEISEQRIQRNRNLEKYKGTDEMCDFFCDAYDCSDEKSCPKAKTCVDKSFPQICDGFVDCLDHSDEQGCQTINKPRFEIINNEDTAKCQDYEKSRQFFYEKRNPEISIDDASSLQIKKISISSFRCDGLTDCTDGSDEINCNEFYKARLDHCTDLDNNDAEDHILYRMKSISDNPGTTIPGALFCLHVDSCRIQDLSSKTNHLSSFEYFDPQTLTFQSLDSHPKCNASNAFSWKRESRGIFLKENPCNLNQFPCKSSFGVKCYPLTQICDGVEDCPPSTLTRLFSKFWDTGKSDEDKTLCKINEDEDYKTYCNNLDKNCNKFKAIDYDDNGYPTCDKVLCYQCRKGYTLSDNRVCVDINECETDYFKSYHHPCSHGCTNTDGGFICDCPVGYVLAGDGKTCKPLSGKMPFLIAKSKYSFMKFNLRQDPLNDDYIIDSEETLLDLSNMNESMIRLAVDEKTQTVYFGYRRIVYSFDLEERKKTEYYEFEDGIPVDMSFDPITGNLYALLVNYRKELCTGKFSDPVSAIAIFPTFARKYSRHPYIQTLPSLYSDGIVIVPQFMEIVPEENVIFVSTPNDIYRIAFDIHSFEKEPTLSTKVTKLKLKATNQLNYFEQVNFDRQRGRLLIFERVESKIISCDSYGEHCNESPRHALKEISQIAILGKTAIFSEFKRPEIVSMDLFNPMKTRVIKRTPVEIFYSIRLMHDQYYNPTNILNDDICDRKNCEFMCVTTPPRGFSRSLGLEDTFQTDAHFGLLGAVCMCPDGSISNKTRTCQDPSNAIDEISDIFAFSVRSNGENRVTRSGRASKKTKLDIVVTNLKTKSSHSIDLRDDELHSFTLSNRFSQPVYIPWSESIGFHHSDESRYFKLMQLPEYQCVEKFQNLELAFDDVKISTKEISTSNLVYLIDTDGYKLYETDDIVHPRYIPDLDIICGIAALHSDRKPVKAVVCWHQNVHENDDFADMNMFTVVFTHSDEESSYKLHDFYADVYGFTAVLTKRQSESADVEGRDVKVFTKVLFHAWSNYTLGITDTITTSFKVKKSSYDKNLMARIWDFDLQARTALMSYANTIRYFYPNSTSVRDFSYHEYVIRSSSKTVTVSSMTRFGDRFIGVYQRFKEKSGGYLSNDVIFDCNLSEQAMNNPCKPFIKLPDHFTEKYSVTQDNMITLFLNKTDIPRRSWNQKNCYNTCGELLCVPQKDKIPITCLCHEGHIWDKEKKMCTKGIEICKGFVCAISRKCIEPNKICDGKFDCDDNFRGVLGLSEDDKSDEMNCQNTCSSGQYQCESASDAGMLTCVNWDQVCDGVVNCPKGDDEQLGDKEPTKMKNGIMCRTKELYKAIKKRCPSNAYACDGSLVSGLCVDFSMVDDGITQCKGVDDDESTIARKHKCSFQKDHWCVQSEKCISKALKCNGVHDCLGESSYSRSDISDEEDCKSYHQACPNSHFRCTHSNACISKDYLCDGINHCGDYQDEKLDLCKNKTVDKIVRHSYNLRRSPEQCPLQKECVSTQTNEIICLTESLMCNYRQDCLDGEDEGELCDGCSQLTNEQKRDCQHCINSPEGPICQCQQNDLKRYVHVDFFKNSSVCSGIDFCQFLGTCDQICESNVGREMSEENPHFECKCRHGWKLDDEDKRTCSIAFEPFASIIPYNKHRHSFLALDTFGNLRLLNGHGVVVKNLLEEASARVVKHLQSGGVDSRPRLISAWLTDSRAFDRLVTGYYGSIDTLPLAYIQADFDGYDSLYVLEISKYKDDIYGMRTYEIRFDLPPMYIDAIALTRNQRPWGYAYHNYNRIYVSGNMPLYNKNLYTIHLVLENGFAVKLYESTEKISCLLYHGISNLLYFSENNQLRVLQFKNNTESQVGSELIHSFEGRITALKNDESFEKLWIVLDNSQIFFIDYHGISTPVEISLRPKLTTINDITICESSLYVSDSESKFLWRYNKFSGIQDEANAKQLQQVTDDPLAASNVEYLWLHNVKNEKLGLKKNKLDTRPNVSVVIGKDVKDFRADWEKNAVEGNLNANLCSPDLVNRFFSTRNGYNNSGYFACDEDFKLVEFDYDGAAMDHTPEIEVICSEKKGIYMLGENVHFTECVDNSGFRHDVFYQNETECKNDCTFACVKSKVKAGYRVINSTFYCQCPSELYGRGCKLTRHVPERLSAGQRSTTGQIILISFLVVISIFAFCGCLTAVYRETKNRGWHTGLSPYRSTGVSYKDFHDAENDFKASRKNSKVTLVSEKSFDHAIPESSMGFNLSDEKLKNADVGNDLLEFNVNQGFDECPSYEEAKNTSQNCFVGTDKKQDFESVSEASYSSTDKKPFF